MGKTAAQDPLPAYIPWKDYFISDADRWFEPYDLECDSLGYIYFTGVGGNHRFNGQEFYTIPGDSIVNRISCDRLFWDSRDRLWALSLKLQPMMVTQSGLESYPYINLIRSQPWGKIRDMQMDHRDTMHIGAGSRGYFKITPEGELIEVIGLDSKLNGLIITKLKDGTPFHFVVSQPNWREKEQYIYFMHPNGEISTITPIPKAFPNFESTLLFHDDGTWTLSPGNEFIVRGSGDSLIKIVEYPYHLLKLFEDSRGAMWLGTIRGGIHKVLNHQYDQPEIYWKGDVAAVTAEDHQGRLLAKSKMNKLLVIPNPDTRVFSKESGHLSENSPILFCGAQGRIYAVYGSTDIEILDGESVERFKAPLAPALIDKGVKSYGASAIYYDTINNRLWTGSWFHLFWRENGQWDSIRIPPSQLNGYRFEQFLSRPDGSLLARTYSDIVVVKGNKIDTIIHTSPTIKTMYEMALGDSGSIWIAGGNGLWYWDGKQLSRPVIEGIPESILHSYIARVQYHEGRLWIQTDENGLYVVENNTAREVRDRSGKRLKLNSLTKAANGDIWGRMITSRTELARFTIEDDSVRLKKYTMEIAIHRYGSLPGALHVWGNHLFLSTTGGGIYRMRMDQLRERGITPKVNFTRIYVNTRSVSQQATYDLSYDQNAINLEFEAPSWSVGPADVRFRMIGMDSNWIRARFLGRQYTNLEPGTYRFQAQARVKKGAWGAVNEITFNIATPYWRTWWFLSLAVVGSVSLIYLSAFFYFRGQRKRSQLEIAHLKAEQRALRAQMNPHFIYNALSSIQDLVFSEDRVFAVTNIALFARLMRRILAQSTEEAITLEQEVETLELYLKLEALRFEERFAYEIVVSDAINQKKQSIPPMFIQPFVENAIKHGLLNKQPLGGKLSIRFEQYLNGLKCVVEDDGVGREMAAQLRKKRNPTHRSFSTQSVDHRIDLLNTNREKKIKLKVVDLYEGEKAKGTRIELLIP